MTGVYTAGIESLPVKAAQPYVYLQTERGTADCMWGYARVGSHHGSTVHTKTCKGVGELQHNTKKLLLLLKLP